MKPGEDVVATGAAGTINQLQLNPMAAGRFPIVVTDHCSHEYR